jgi:acetylornithine deacetylase/succinyl-diaminopimelate desuccinylase-like protein
MSVLREDLVALLTGLIEIDSRNPWLIAGAPGEGEVAALLARRVRHLGLEVAVDEVAPGRPNVVVRWPGSGDGRSLCLNSHIDTVGHAGWPDRALRPDLVGDRMVGLGAADDKGSVALAMLVLESLLRSGTRLRGDLVVAFVMDEEARSLGTQDLVTRHLTDAAIVLEPLALGKALVTHQGFGWLDIVVHGRSAHGSAPELGIDAIGHAAPVLRRLDALGAEWAARPHPMNGATVYHASTVTGGSDYASYPSACTIGIEIGTQPGETIADRVRDIEAIFDATRAELPDFSAEVIVQLDRDPFEASGHEELWDAAADATLRITGQRLQAVGENAWMDAALLQAAGIATISLGATSERLHAPDEWVDVGELLTLGEILESTIRSYCGEVD